MKGKVKYWKHDKGYGFIGREGGTDVFVHITEMPNGIIPAIGEAVEFGVIHDEQGRERAINVQLIYE